MKLFKKIIYSLVSLVLISSCSEEFLELKPVTAIPTEDVFGAYSTAQAASVGTYRQLSSFGFDGLYEPIMADIIGEDIMINSVNNYNWFVAVYQLNVLPNYVFPASTWDSGYKVLNDANMILANVGRIPDATEEQKKHLEAQAKVMRAYVMLKLVQEFAPSFAEDPEAKSIMLVTEPKGAEDHAVPRAPLSDVYAQIETDLLSAIGLFSAIEGDINTNDVGFFNKRAAQAILARAYLNTREWEDARDMAKAAYDGVTLMTQGERQVDPFYYRNSETIFTLAYTQDVNNVYLTIPSFYYPANGYSSIRLNDKFVEQFSNSDVRKYYIIRQDNIDTDRWLTVKFWHNGPIGNAERIAIRASEMYLIEAECEAELGNYEEAQNALHVIRERAQPGVQKSLATGQELIDQILLERRKELYGEGFRWNDIKRRLGRFKREGDHWAKFDFGPEDTDYYKLTFPIPQSEIDVNPLITKDDQNKGY